MEFAKRKSFMNQPNVQYQPQLRSDVLSFPEVPRGSSAKSSPAVAVRSEAAVAQLNLNGVRILLGLGFSIGLAGLFLWESIRHWLFAP
jgi:hypothetical protein